MATKAMDRGRTTRSGTSTTDVSTFSSLRFRNPPERGSHEDARPSAPAPPPVGLVRRNRRSLSVGIGSIGHGGRPNRLGRGQAHGGSDGQGSAGRRGGDDRGADRTL